MLSFLSLVVAASAVVATQVRPKLSEAMEAWLADRDTLCHTLSSSFFAPWRCKSKSATQRRFDADEFRRTHGLSAADEPAPIILLPGFAASGLDAKLDRPEQPYWFCWSKWDTWFNLWVAYYEILTSSCLLSNMGLVYNATTDSFTNKPGVTTRPRDFGGLTGVDWVDHTDDVFGWTLVFGDMISSLEQLGFKRGVTLFGAPFRWVLHLRGIVESEFGEDMKTLVDTAYAAAGNKKVHIVTHSYGGLVAVYWMNNFIPAVFNNNQTAYHAWLRSRVESFVPIAGPFSGTSKALRSVLSGDTFGLPEFLINRANMVADVRTIGGAVQLTPDAGFWPPKFAFVRTPAKNYTANDMHAAMTDAGADVSAAIFSHTKHIIDEMNPPPVQTYCMYGFGHETELAYVYDEGLSRTELVQPSTIVTGDGDGTVPLLSLLECQYWDTLPSEDVYCREYKLDDAGHADLDNPDIIGDVALIGLGRVPFNNCTAPALDAYIDTLDELPRKAKQIRENKQKSKKQN